MLTSQLGKLSLETLELQVNLEVEFVLHTCCRSVELDGSAAVKSLHLHSLLLAGEGRLGDHVHQWLDLNLRLEQRVSPVLALQLLFHAFKVPWVRVALCAASKAHLCS